MYLADHFFGLGLTKDYNKNNKNLKDDVMNINNFSKK